MIDYYEHTPYHKLIYISQCIVFITFIYIVLLLLIAQGYYLYLSLRIEKYKKKKKFTQSYWIVEYVSILPLIVFLRTFVHFFSLEYLDFSYAYTFYRFVLLLHIYVSDYHLSSLVFSIIATHAYKHSFCDCYYTIDSEATKKNYYKMTSR